MIVWVDTSAVEAQDVARVLTTGVNGVITTQSTVFSSILKQFPKNTLLRKPFIIGHRGVPSLEDENTLESAKHAVALGADIVENDIYSNVILFNNTYNRADGNKKFPIINFNQAKYFKGIFLIYK